MRSLLGTLTMPFLIVMGVVTVFYLLDSLYADRRDRTVLFWKSLPVSDQETVLSKLATASVAVPVLIFAGSADHQRAGGPDRQRAPEPGRRRAIWPLVWNASVWFPAMAIFLYMLVVAVLWYLPIFAWLLLVSASAGRRRDVVGRSSTPRPDARREAGLPHRLRGRPPGRSLGGLDRSH